MFNWLKSRKKALSMSRNVENTTGGAFPSSRIDYSSRTSPTHKNSAVMACVGWVQRTFPEAQVKLRDIDTRKKYTESHQYLKLMRNPNPENCADNIWQSTVFSLFLSGNAFWYKVRDRYDIVKELWWLPHNSIDVEFSTLTGYTTGYRTVLNGKSTVISPDDIIHFKFGVNLNSTKLGYSPLLSAFPEVASDNEATQYTSTILRNLGVPGGVISPKNEEMDLTKEQIDQIERRWMEKVSGDRRGAPFISTHPLDVHKLYLSPEELALDKIRSYPEDRICAALGIPSIVVGLTSSANQKTYANYREAREAALENCVFPLHKLVASTLDLQLLGFDFHETKLETFWDYSEVRATQEAENKKWLRSEIAFRAGVVTLNEARNMIDLSPVDNGDQFVSAFTPSAYGAEGILGDDNSSQGRPRDKSLSLVELNGYYK